MRAVYIIAAIVVIFATMAVFEHQSNVPARHVKEYAECQARMIHVGATYAESVVACESKHP